MTTEAGPRSKPGHPIQRLLGRPRTEKSSVDTSEDDEGIVFRSRVARFGWLYGSIWLFYLIEPAVTATHHENRFERIFGLVALGAFAIWYIAIFASIRVNRWHGGDVIVKRAWFSIGLLMVLALLTIPASGSDGLATLVYIIAAGVMVLPQRHAGILSGVLVGGVVLLNAVSPSWNTGAGLLFGMVVSGIAVWGVRQMIARNADLVAAQQEIARLAVAEERARTARDMHDILGHSLTVITVKAELAGRLIRADPDKAEKEVADLERLSRQALADVRNTVRGYRSVTLAEELASARSALDAAGIEAEIPHAIDDVPTDRRELFGWVVREGVTNVVRHSGAANCEIRVGRDHVEVLDDGSGPPEAAADGDGGGLRGLRERVERVGGSLTVGRSGMGGFLLRVTVSQ